MMWTLLGIAVVIAGFAARINPLLVIAAAAGVTGVAAQLSGVAPSLTPVHIVAAFGKAFAANRFVSVVFLVLPVIGLLERYGLQERARMLIGRLRGATAGRLLLVYFLLRQVAAAVGVPFGGHAQVVRPLLAPMAEGAAEAQTGGELAPKQRFWLRAHAAAAENIGLFFGEDIFVAIGSILLIKGFLETNKIVVEPFALSVWAIPTAVLAAAIHGTRLWLIDKRLSSPSPPRSGGEGGVRGS
ncbi:MAG TPA: DUF969 domain-containing protein [Rhizomicrobium sp.]|jgi:uncharacterized membrane protein|nr:DUF969 domain-containing protein [Rhizomicrobium sp.]